MSDRPSRSTDHDATMSNSLAFTAFIMASSPGRLSLPFAPADASILIDVYDLPTGSICDRFQLSALIFGVLLRGAERYFHRHVIFHDHPGALDETDGATGILQPRFIGKV